VRLFITDVDGVWTDGRIEVHADGSEGIVFHVHDGLGVRLLQKAGLEIAVISGRRVAAVEHRLRKPDIRELHLGVLEKGPLVTRLREERGLAVEEIAAMGDDILDLPMFAQAGFSLAPATALEEVRRQADYTTRAPAGGGALREACDLLLAATRRKS